MRQGQDVHPSQFAVRSSEDVFARERPLSTPPLGRVTSVSGSRAVVAVDISALSLEDSDPLSVGKLLLIEAGHSLTVSLIYAAEAAGPTKLDTMLASVELLGEIRVSKTTGKRELRPRHQDLSAGRRRRARDGCFGARDDLRLHRRADDLDRQAQPGRPDRSDGPGAGSSAKTLRGSRHDRLRKIQHRRPDPRSNSQGDRIRRASF